MLAAGVLLVVFAIPGYFETEDAAPGQDSRREQYETAYGCRPSGVSDALESAERLIEGIIDLESYPAVAVGADVDWSLDPYDNSWVSGLHNMTFIYPLFEAYIETGDQRYLQQAEGWLRDWVRDNIPSPESDWAWIDRVAALRTQVMACSSAFIGVPEWLSVSMDQHAEFLADPENYSGPWNHGLDQDLGLLAVGCTLEETEMIDEALDRSRASVQTMVDEQGVTNEQAVGYHYYDWTLFTELAEEISRCGQEPIDVLDRRHEIPRFMAHATQPDGRWVPIGDSYPAPAKSIPDTMLEYAATAGRSGVLPEDDVAVFDRGWIFGRTGWGTDRPFQDEAFYSIRFGPGREVHGHRDHTSITYFADGQNLLTEAGFGGYQKGLFRSFEQGEAAHNQVVIRDGGRYRWDATTVLNMSEVTEDSHAFDLFDRPYAGIDRRRTVLFVVDSEVMVIRDSLVLNDPSMDAVTFQQLWHLPAGADVDVEPGRAVSRTSTSELHIVQVGDGLELTVVEGQDEPLQGWVAGTRDERLPASVLSTSVTDRQVEFLTIIAAAEDLEVDRAGTTIRLSVDGAAVKVRVDPSAPLPLSLVR